MELRMKSIFICILMLNCSLHISESLKNYLGRSTSADCDLTIECVSPCIYTSVCYGLNDQDSYFTCSWVDTSNQLQDYTATIISVQNFKHNCKAPVRCSQNANSETQCEVIFPVNASCQFLEISTTTVKLTVERNSVNDSCTTTTQPFKPCYNIVLGAPELNVTSSDNTAILVELGPPSCLSSFINWAKIEYSTQYTSYNGVSTTPVITHVGTDESFSGVYHESSLYNFTAYAVVSDIPSSNVRKGLPAIQSYLTKPDRAADNDYLQLSCQDRDNTSIVTVAWKKTGIVDEFFLTVTGDSIPTLSQGYSVPKVTQNETAFSMSINLDFDMEYEISLVAGNTAGISNATLKQFTKKSCETKFRSPSGCVYASGGETWMSLEWIAPSDRDAYDSFDIISYADDNLVAKRSVNSTTFSYNVTELKPCTLYTQVVESVFGKTTVGSCSFQSYAVETRPIASPNFKVQSISSNEISIEIIPLASNFACGIVTSYTVTYYSNEEDLKTKTSKSPLLQFIDLIPYTKYNILVSAVNSGGTGPTKVQGVVTGQAAPATPPVLFNPVKVDKGFLIRWQPPSIANGEIFCYILSFGISSWDNSKVNCNSSVPTIYGGEQTNATLYEPPGTIVALVACTGAGDLCSDWSNQIQIPVDSSPSSIIIASVCSILGIALILVLLYLVISSLRSTKVVSPAIHKDILNDLYQTPTVIKRSNHYENFESSQIGAQYENVDSVFEWRGWEKKNSEQKRKVQTQSTSYKPGKQNKGNSPENDVCLVSTVNAAELKETFMLDLDLIETSVTDAPSMETVSTDADNIDNIFSENIEGSDQLSYITLQAQPDSEIDFTITPDAERFQMDSNTVITLDSNQLQIIKNLKSAQNHESRRFIYSTSGDSGVSSMLSQGFYPSNYSSFLRNYDLTNYDLNDSASFKSNFNPKVVELCLPQPWTIESIV